MWVFYLRILIHEFYNQFSSSQNTTSDYYIIISYDELLREVLLFSAAVCICAMSYFISNWQEQHGMKDHVGEYKLSPHFNVLYHQATRMTAVTQSGSCLQHTTEKLAHCTLCFLHYFSLSLFRMFAALPSTWQQLHLA